MCLYYHVNNKTTREHETSRRAVTLRGSSRWFRILVAAHRVICVTTAPHTSIYTLMTLINSVLQL